MPGRGRAKKVKKSPTATAKSQGKIHDSTGTAGASTQPCSPPHTHPLNSPSSVCSIESPCVKCGKEVVDKATNCDRCKRYTHISCDENMNEDIYEILAKFPSNPLIYLCSECRPKFSGDVNHERYIDCAMSKLDQALKESHSSTEFQLDLLVQAVTSRLGNLESKTTDVSCQISDLNNRVHQSLKSVHQCDLSVATTGHHSAIPSAPPDPEYQLSDQSEPCLSNGTVPRPVDSNRRNQSDDPPGTPGQNQTRQISHPNSQPRFVFDNDYHANTPPNIRHMRHVLNNLSDDTRFTQNLPTPPNIGYMRDAMSQYQCDNHTQPRLQMPPPPNNRYRGPPLHPIGNNRHDPPPNPEVSLVVYGLDPLGDHKNDIVNLAKECDVDLSGITTIKKLPSTRPRPPVLVSCSDGSTKWHMIRYINSVDNIYAKPFLLGEERRKDRVLVNHLRELRQSHPTKVFKIYRGDIYQEVDDNFVRLRPNNNSHSLF